MPPFVSATPSAGTLDTGSAPGSAVLLASASRTATPASVVFSPGSQHQVVTVTVKGTTAGSPSTVVTVEIYDQASDSWIVVLTGAAIVATGTVEYTVGPNAPVTTNLSANCALGPYMRVTATHGNGTAHVYSVGVRARYQPRHRP